MMRAAIFLSLVVIVVWVTIAANPRPVLFVNGHILTLDAESSVADSLLISDGKIEAIGPEALISNDLPIFTRTIDLRGKTVLPGFVDAHSHFPSSGLTQAGLDLTPPPVGNVSTLQLLLDDCGKTNDWTAKWLADHVVAAPFITRKIDNNELELVSTIAAGMEYDETLERFNNYRIWSNRYKDLRMSGGLKNLRKL